MRVVKNIFADLACCSRNDHAEDNLPNFWKPDSEVLVASISMLPLTVTIRAAQELARHPWHCWQRGAIGSGSNGRRWEKGCWFLWPHSEGYMCTLARGPRLLKSVKAIAALWILFVVAGQAAANSMFTFSMLDSHSEHQDDFRRSGSHCRKAHKRLELIRLMPK